LHRKAVLIKGKHRPFSPLFNTSILQTISKLQGMPLNTLKRKIITYKTGDEERR